MNKAILFDIERKVKLWFRIPIIPDVNDSIEEMQKIKKILKTIGAPEAVRIFFVQKNPR